MVTQAFKECAVRRVFALLASPVRPRKPKQEHDSRKKPKRSRWNTSFATLFSRPAVGPSQPSPTPHPQTAGTSPAPAECIPPPFVNNTATGPGHFTADLDNRPSSDPTPQPYAPVLHRSQSHEPEPPVEGAPSETTQRTDPQFLNATAQNSTDLPVSSNGGEQEGGADKSSPIDIPQKRQTFFDHLGSSSKEQHLAAQRALDEQLKDRSAKIDRLLTDLTAREQPFSVALEGSERKDTEMDYLHSSFDNSCGAIEAHGQPLTTMRQELDELIRSRDELLDQKMDLEKIINAQAVEAESLRSQIQEPANSLLMRKAADDLADPWRQMEKWPVAGSLNLSDTREEYVTNRFKLLELGRD